jgi:hypothetical protein
MSFPPILTKYNQILVKESESNFTHTNIMLYYETCLYHICNHKIHEADSVEYSLGVLVWLSERASVRSLSELFDG